MGAGQFGHIGIRLVTLMVVGLALPRALAAQAGAGSRVAQVTLVARVAPRASIESVSPTRETGRQGSVREASVTVRFSTNTGYRLAVLRTPGGRITRVWVRAADGSFRDLAPGSSVTVAQGARGAGEWEHEVSYRVESDSRNGVVELPVRYEIRVTPTI